MRAYTILWRDAQTAVLVTQEQRGVSHLLVLPVHHYATILEIPDFEAGELMVALRDAATTIAQASNARGIAVWQNNGIPAHQAIAHLHFHVAGTLEDGGTDFGNVPEVSITETALIASRLVPSIPPRVGRIVSEFPCSLG